MEMHQLFILLSCILCVTGLDMEAGVSMSNITARITFSTSSPDSAVTIRTEFTRGWTNGMTWFIHEFPLIYSTDRDRCSEANIGARLTDLTSEYGSPQEMGNHDSSTGTTRLIGSQGIAGRTLVITDGTTVVCASIQRVNAPMAKATIQGGVSGTIEFRELTPGHVTVLIDTFHTSSNPSTTVFALGIYGQGQDGDNCQLGVRRSTMAAITPGFTQGSSRRLVIDTSLFYAQIINSYVALLNGNQIVQCAQIQPILSKTVISTFSMNGISGEFMFTQSTPYDPTRISYKLESLQNEAGGFHVHQYPLTYQYSSSDNVCSPASVGGHWNPLNSATPQHPGTEDFFEIGDMSSKYGSLSGQTSVSRMAVDWNLPLFGRFSIVGRSIVIHRASDGSRWACADIGYPRKVIVAEAVLVYPVIGRVLFKQDSLQSNGDTSIYIELSHTQNLQESQGHGIHVHTNPVGGDNLVETGRCATTGGHYNPFAVSLIDYQNCGPQSMLRCELGDISSKHGSVSIGQDGSYRRTLVTDSFMPLSGKYSILGRSVVLHAADGSRLACGDIKVFREVETNAMNWIGVDPSIVGTVNIHGNDNNPHATVSVFLTQLANRFGGYHVHQHPVSPGTTVPSQVCSGRSVGGHYNPLGVQGSPATGTHDQYEIGDLSGKFGSLSGNSMLSATHLDTNLPTRGVNSVMGRSVVLHAAADGSRLACSNIDYRLQTGVKKIEASATFTGEVSGTVSFTNLIYPDGSTVDTTITVDLYYTNDPSRVTTGHNWHVHVFPIDGSCASAGPHYNPFKAPASEARYGQFCSRSNPLYCELGDLSNKQGQYSIGGGKQTVNDVNVPLTGPHSVIGRSVVFHAESGGGPRIACADIVPQNSFSFIHAFRAATTFVKSDFLAAVSAVVPNFDAVVTQPRPVPGSPCQEVTIFLSDSSNLNPFLRNAQNLGPYSRSLCLSSEGDRSCRPNGPGTTFIQEVVPGTQGKYFNSIVAGTVFGAQSCPPTTKFDISKCLCNFPGAIGV